MLANDYTIEVDPVHLGRHGLQPRVMLELRRLDCEHRGLDFDSEAEGLHLDLDERYDETDVYSSPEPSTDVDEEIRNSGLKLQVDVETGLDMLVPIEIVIIIYDRDSMCHVYEMNMYDDYISMTTAS